jgi:hypothetical protein
MKQISSFSYYSKLFSKRVITLNLVEYCLDTMFKQIKFAKHNKALTATNFRPVLSYERKK